MEFLATVLLFAGMLLGLAVIPFGLPGMAVILTSVLLYAILTGFSAGIGVFFFIVVCVLTLIAETADNWLTALGAKRYGASTGSMWLSMLGGIAGAILIGGPTALLLGPLGPIVGGFAGAFLIVAGWERIRGRSIREALRAGWGTFLGRAAGIVLKFVIAVATVVAVTASVLYTAG
jgi:uncharacterized protein YqgC (DUF456 family)